MVTVRAKGLCLEVTGHAGWAPRGSDLVCAGVSVLTATLAAAVTELWEQGRLNTQPEIAMGKGKAKILCREETPEALQAFQTVLSGYRLLARQYPQNVVLINE